MTIIEPDYVWAYALSIRSVTDTIVIHHAAANGETAEQIHNYHKNVNGWAGIAYHYYVRKDGSVYRGRPENTIGGHTLNENGHTIGICFEGDYENVDTEMPAVQLEAGQELIADIKTRYPDIAIKRHKDYNATACPGKNFPFEELTEEMTQEKFNEMMDAYLTEKQNQELSSWSQEAREWAEGNGLITGDGSGNMQYKSACTREMMVVFLHRFYNLIKSVIGK
ncbi:MAG: N-acetylmuramoyl-L-alanine amidase [Oscillospiraceae bacterium]